MNPVSKLKEFFADLFAWNEETIDSFQKNSGHYNVLLQETGLEDGSFGYAVLIFEGKRCVRLECIDKTSADTLFIQLRKTVC
jgi:hypothetical protein